MGKLKNNITIALDDETAATVQALAKHYQRKPAELVRLLLVPVIRSQWLQTQKEQHPENNAEPVAAKFPQFKEF